MKLVINSQIDLSVCDQFCSSSRLVTQVSDEANHKLTKVNTARSLIFGH